MASNPLYTHPLVDLYRTIGLQRGASPAFINASIAQGISESSLDPNARGDGGQARGLHQWHPDRYNNLLALSQKMRLPPTDPRVQINHWYDENKNNLGIADPRAANDAALGSERPAGWKPGDPTGVPSYNKRLGDTMALMRMTGGQPNPQDPNSFVATAPNTPQPTEGISPQAQAINLTEENSQPLNNLGSTLANMGASIASLDRGGTGIASLNASKVASNLAAQEAAREREVGWKYAGQTQNGQGMIFQNSKGQIRVEPLAEGFTGQKEPESIRALRILQSDPSLVGLKKELSGGETAPMEPGLKKDLGSLWAAGDDSVLSRQDAKSRQEIMAAGIDEIKAAGLDPKEVMANRIAYKGDLADDRRRSQIIAALDTYKGEFLAGAKQASDYIRKLPEGLQQKPLNELYQWAQTNAGTPEGKAINDAKVALESMNRGYNRAVSTSSNGNVTGEKRISELFNPALPAKMLLSGVEVLTGDVTRLNKFALEARDNARARRAGKAIPHPEIEDEDKAISAIVGETGGSKRSTIGNTTRAPTNIRTPDELKNWLSSSGLKKGEKFTLPDGSEGIVP